MGNKIEELSSQSIITDSLIANKNKQIEVLRWRDTVRTNQLAEANFKIMQSEAEEKRLKRLVIVYKIGAIIALSVALISLF